MKTTYLLVLLMVVSSGCKRSAASTRNERVAPSLSKNERVAVVEFSPDGRRMFTTSEDGNARIWDAHTGQPLSQTNGTRLWDLSRRQHTLPRYEAGTPDNMPMVGGDSFKVLQDQIDALEKRVRELENRTTQTSQTR